MAGATRLISSPLSRARDTAEALGTGLPVEIDDRWVEVDYGEYDGQKLGGHPRRGVASLALGPRLRPAGRREPGLGRIQGAGGL